jgi:hypothetical protein
VVGGVFGGAFALVLLPMLSDRVMARVKGFLTTLRADPANLHPGTATTPVAAEDDTEPPKAVADGRDSLTEPGARDDRGDRHRAVGGRQARRRRRGPLRPPSR